MSCRRNKSQRYPKTMVENHADFFRFTKAEALINRLSGQIETDLNESVEKRNRGSLIVSGGATPVPLFKKLAHADLPWAHITIGLADERWVEPTDKDSNEKLVRTHLLQDRASVATFKEMKIKNRSAIGAENICAGQYKKIPSPFDVVILGMGTDGHTASWFPGADRLSECVRPYSEKICVGIHSVKMPHDRLTLTLSAILNARRIFVHIEGPDKYQTYQRAAAGGLFTEMPIRYILGQKNVPVTVYWAP